jgi:predicted PurR-regulated permease PerM
MLSIILIFYGVIVARDFLYPLAFAVLISYLLYPLVNFFEKWRVPRILSILLAEVVALVMVIFAGIFIYRQISVFVGDFPAFKTKAIHNIDFLTEKLENIFGLSDHSLINYVKAAVKGFFEVGSSTFNTFFQNTAGAIIKIALLPVYVFLFLYYRTKFATFILKIVPHDMRFTAVRIMREISQVATSYMGGVIIVVSVLCIINSVGLYIIDMKYALTLGIISALFSFIPYFGTLMGGSVPILFALLISDNPLSAIRVLILFIIINTIENNILTPNIVGGSLRINPFFIILSLIVGAIVWGIPGMIVVVPFLAILKIIFKHTPRLSPYSYLLGNSGTRRHAITANKIKRLFKK